MGIGKSIETPSGVNAEYWQVSFFQYRGGLIKILSVTMAGYVDQAAADAGKAPLDAKTVEFNQDDSLELLANKAGFQAALEAKILGKVGDFDGALAVADTAIGAIAKP